MNDERWMLDCEFSRDKTFQHIEFKRERDKIQKESLILLISRFRLRKLLVPLQNIVSLIAALSLL